MALLNLHRSFFEDPFYLELSPFESEGSSRQLRAVSSGFDVEERSDCYAVHADLPGLGEEDVRLELNNRVLTVSAEKQEESREEKAGKLVRSSRRARSFKRTLQLPEDVEEERISATMDKGVLQVLLPKKQAPEPRRIQVQRREAIASPGEAR